MILIILAACSTANLNKQLLQIKVFKEERKLKLNSLYMGQFIKLLLSSLIWTFCPQACNQESEACTMYSVQCTVYTTLYSVQCTLQCTVYSVHYNVHWTVYTTIYSVQYTLQCTVYSVQYNLQCTVCKLY